MYAEARNLTEDQLMRFAYAFIDVGLPEDEAAIHAEFPHGILLPCLLQDWYIRDGKYVFDQTPRQEAEHSKRTPENHETYALADKQPVEQNALTQLRRIKQKRKVAEKIARHEKRAGI